MKDIEKKIKKSKEISFKILEEAIPKINKAPISQGVLETLSITFGAMLISTICKEKRETILDHIVKDIEKISDKIEKGESPFSITKETIN